jgi:predicted permease
MQVLFNVVLPVFIVASIAALAHARLHFDTKTLSRAAFYLFSPALIFDSLTASDVSGAEFGQIAVVLLLVTLALWALGALGARLLRLEGPTQAAFVVAILIMNAGNYGLSVNFFAFGEPGLGRASLFFTVSAVLGSSLGVYLSARGRAPFGLALRRMAGVPLLHAAVLGLVLKLGNLTVPEPLAKSIHLLGQASVPAMLSVLGIQLAETFKSQKRILHLPALGAVTVIRLILAPALAWIIAALMGLESLTRSVVVVESAMPTAVIATILATEFESDPPFSALCVLVTTLVSVPTVTLVLNLLWLYG